MFKRLIKVWDLPQELFLFLTKIQDDESKRIGRHCTQGEAVKLIIREYKTLKHEKETQNNNTNA